MHDRKPCGCPLDIQGHAATCLGEPYRATNDPVAGKGPRPSTVSITGPAPSLAERGWDRDGNSIQHDVVPLDPLDEFDSILIAMKKVHDAKRADYSADDNRFSNFEFAAQYANVEVWQVFEVLLGVKQARINNLRKDFKVVINEPIEDTLLDRTNYSALALAYYRKMKR